MYTRLLVVSFLSIWVNQSLGQYALHDFDLRDSAIHWFDEKAGLQMHEVFTGVYHSLEGRPAIDKATWGNAIWSIGQLAYRGEVYQNIYLLYDLENDLLLTKNHLNSSYFNQPIRLNQEQIQWFAIGDDWFVRRGFTSMDTPAGFFHQIFTDRDFSFYAKRRRVRKLEVNQILFEADDTFYLVAHDRTSQVEKAGSLYKLFPEHRSRLKGVFKSLRIRKFENATIGQLREMARRCAEIIAPS